MKTLVFSPGLMDRVTASILKRHPVKSFGYFISDTKAGIPTDFIIFEGNNRNARGWKEEFESFGQYFVDHSDAGFVATPEEIWKFKKETRARGMFEVGVFHSHQRHPANFSRVDYEMHMKSVGKQLWHVIFSMRTPDYPQARAFEIHESGVSEIRLLDSEKPATEERLPKPKRTTASPLRDKSTLLADARELLRSEENGLPLHVDPQATIAAIEDVLSTDDQSLIAELLSTGIFRDRERRYDEFVAEDMRPLKGGDFLMGTDRGQSRPYCGETPKHHVTLRDFSIGRFVVTDALFSKWSLQSNIHVEDRTQPKVNVTWYEAKLFAMWMGCRLLTEAEWEFACSRGEEWQWCCESESDLVEHAWYSENSGGRIHPVGLKRPNSCGVFDMHGNVWEWCEDNYDDSFYSRPAGVSPVNKGPGFRNKDGTQETNRVTRGGCMHSHAEMCRSRYRFHEPPSFSARDLGFRLCR
jgi:formylglycine-generating enzyme required for sulfatase activity/proteasome lid subunit RPN8/RPN11